MNSPIAATKTGCDHSLVFIGAGLHTGKSLS